MSRTRWVVAGVCVLALGVHDAPAFEVEAMDTRYLDRQYELKLVVVLDAPLPRVRAVLGNYANYPRLDARILEAKVLSRPAVDEVLLYTVLRACFGIVCRNVKRVERVREYAHALEAVVLPEQSEVLRGETRTELTALDQRTQVDYHTRMAPGFWVPAFVGRSLMLRTLREASLELFRNIEAQARSSPS